jgi:hypothetical protein
MSFLTRDILNFYKFNEKNSEYLIKYFSDTLHLGFYYPYAKDAVDTQWNGKDPFVGTIDEQNIYEINRFGFRGEIDQSSDILASGCSITFGLGVPESGRWTNFLSNKINKSVTNLGSPGASVESICNNIIQYSLMNKMPKEIFCLFPDFFRSMVVVDKEFYRSKVSRGSVGKSEDLSLIYCNPDIEIYKESLFMDIKDQKYIEDYRSPHQLILDSVNSIYILESFCLINNIKLHWTTWDLPSSLIMQELSNLKDFKLKNFRSFFTANNMKRIGSFVYDNCKSYHDSDFKDNLCWHKGSDYSIINYKKTSEMAHPGIHLHYHVSDFFYNLHKENSEDEQD